MFQRRFLSLLVCGLTLAVLPSVLAAAPPKPAELLKNARRILFLGDSNTYAGTWVAGFEAWQLTQPAVPGQTVLNVGLPSETVSGLSEEGHAGGKFPRPDVAERLTRVLDLVKPDLVFTCWGMNCGVYQPLDEARFEKYKSGYAAVLKEILARGAKVVILTPPYYDDAVKPHSGFKYDDVLGKYSEWLLTLQSDEIAVIDVHGPMIAEVAKRRIVDAKFTFSPDAVHPNAEGGWFVTQQILRWTGDDGAASQPSPEAMLKAAGLAPEVYPLVQKRMAVLRDSYLTTAGHKRPGMAQGLPVSIAEKTAAELTREILAKLGK
jgi:lysophospholipase L1-like esterase